MEGFLDFCSSLSLFAPFFSPSALAATCCSPGWQRGLSLSAPSAPPLLPAEPQERHLFALCGFKEQHAEAGSRGGWKNQQSHRVCNCHGAMSPFMSPSKWGVCEQQHGKAERLPSTIPSSALSSLICV